MTPYTRDDLEFNGVSIANVEVDKLETYFEHYDFDVSNGVYYSKDEMMASEPLSFIIRQPRINHKPFSIYFDVYSDVEGDAVFKVFLGPKYDSKGYPISLERNWQNFVGLDWFVHKLTKGKNNVERNSSEFFFYKEDCASS